MIHYKYTDEIPFCELADGYFPKIGKGKLKTLPENSTFPQDFCTKCKTKLENLNLIEKEQTP